MVDSNVFLEWFFELKKQPVIYTLKVALAHESNTGLSDSLTPNSLHAASCGRAKGRLFGLTVLAAGSSRLRCFPSAGDSSSMAKISASVIPFKRCFAHQ